MKLDATDIRHLLPVISAVVREVLDELRAEEARLRGRLGYTEQEAAALLGVAPYVIRDCRLRGELKGSKVGRKVVYTREEIERFLAEQTI